MEGALSRESVEASLKRGLKPSGDLIPWTMAQNYLDADFGALSGARIVRIATHPHLHRKGYAYGGMGTERRHATARGSGGTTRFWILLDPFGSVWILLDPLDPFGSK